MSAKLLKVACVADDVITLNEIFDKENAIPLQNLLLFCKLWQFVPNNHFLQSVFDSRKTHRKILKCFYIYTKQGTLGSRVNQLASMHMKTSVS